MTEVRKKKSRWRWVRRGGLGLLVLVVVVGAMPFLFTTAMARWVVGRSAYAPFSPEIGSASLSLGGRLVLREVVLHERGPGTGGKVLLRCGTLEATFSWMGVMGSILKDIRAEDVTVYVRPGEAADGGTPISLLELASSGGRAATQPERARTGGAVGAAAGTIAATEKPLWFDRLSCSGTVSVERMEDFNIAPVMQPFVLTMQMRGDGFRPARDLAVRIGEAGDKAMASAAAHFEPVGEGQRITVDELTLRNVDAGIGEQFAKRALGGWPKVFLQSLDGHVERVSATATFEPGAAGRTFTAQAEIMGVSVSSRPDAQSRLELKGLNVSVTAGGPMGADFLRYGTLEAGTVALDSLVSGKNTLEHFSAPVTLRAGMLEAPSVKATFAGGAFAGLVQFSTADRKLVKATFDVQHLDQALVSANMVPDKIEATGTLSGTINLASGQKSTLTGKIDLRSDGPGRLKIKSEEIAKALADQLQSADASGVLPPNFSDVVVGQLRDYPYKTARIRVADRDGVPILSLDYTRENVQTGEAGFEVKTTMGGKPVLANYTIQLPGVAVVMKGQTIEELLELAAGLGQQIVGADAAK